MTKRKKEKAKGKTKKSKKRIESGKKVKEKIKFINPGHSFCHWLFKNDEFTEEIYAQKIL